MCGRPFLWLEYIKMAKLSVYAWYECLCGAKALPVSLLDFQNLNIICTSVEEDSLLQHEYFKGPTIHAMIGAYSCVELRYCSQTAHQNIFAVSNHTSQYLNKGLI